MSATALQCSQRLSAAQQHCFRGSAPKRVSVSRQRLALRAQRPDLTTAYFDDGQPKGYDRPWIRNDAQPLMAPRSQELSGDPFGMLLKQRIIFMGGEVEDFMADAIISQLLLLDAQDPSKDIKIFINSPGGSVTAGMGIYDAMMLCRSDVQTYCFGLAASMGAFLLGAGKRGKRHSMPNARIMIHQPLGGASGQAVDIEIQAKEIMYHKANINRIMADYCGQPLNKIEEDTDRDRYMSPLEARDYGVIDHIVGGDQATFRVQGSTYAFPRVKEDFITDFEGRDPLFGDVTPGITGGSSARFRRREMEPYMDSLQPGRQWWTLREMTDSSYKEMLEKNKDAGWIKEKVVDPDNDVWLPPQLPQGQGKKSLPPPPASGESASSA